MKREPEIQRVLATIVASATLGAAAMYVLDPDKGRRRRALVRDKAGSLVVVTRDAVGVVARDTTLRMQGLRARARRLFRRRALPDDLVLIERVRARMGRLVSHPHAVQVGAHDGRVTLSGPILAHEVQPLLRAIRNVWGVSEVEDRLVGHERPDSIPSLQGGVERARSHVMQENWAPALRLAAVLGGCAVALYGMRRPTWSGCALAAAGLGLAVRGISNVPMKRLAGIAGGRRAIDRQRTSDAMTATPPRDGALPNSAPTSMLH